MMTYILLGLLNGFAIALSRVLNAGLSQKKGPFYASFWNHIVGFIILFAVIFFALRKYNNISDVPFYCYLGGVIGAFFVAINSYLIPRLGVLNTILFVISGQMITGVLFDLFAGTYSSGFILSLGSALIFVGFWIWKQKNN